MSCQAMYSISFTPVTLLLLLLLLW
jgi:hypothetical protein